MTKISDMFAKRDYKAAVQSGLCCVEVSGEACAGCAALLPVLVRHGGREARFTCLLDTGNGLRDPATGRPVLVVWRQALLPVLAAVEPEQLRPIRYRSLGTESGTLLCFNAGQVTVDGVAYENQPVAIAPSPLSEGMGYAALWNGKERGHGTQRTETEAA